MEEAKIICCKGRTEELEDILDFVNMVFSMDSNNSVDFAALLPKAYSRECCGRLVHHMVKEQGKIRALIDLYPITLQLCASSKAGKRLLHAAYIGTVSVHPNSRGKGYMIKLMEMAEKTAIAQGCDLMILDGNRHRYQHCGFEKAGIRYSFHVGKRNISHCCDSMYDSSYMEAPVYSFEEIDADSPHIEKMFELYLQRNVTARTKQDFFLCLQSYGAVTYAVLKEEEMIGYVNIEGEKEILEFELVDYSELPRVIYDLMEGIEATEFNFEVGLDESDKIEYLEKMSDYYNVGMSHQIKILNYANVLEFLFAWKQEYSTPENGTYIIGVKKENSSCKEESSENYLIKLSDSGVNVEMTERTADIVLDAFTFIQMFTTSYCLSGLPKDHIGKLKNAPSDWFPLPFFLPNADTF